MDAQQSFNEIVQKFRDELIEFSAINNFDEGSILVHFKGDRPSGTLTTLKNEPVHDVAFLNDAYFVLYQDSSKSS